MSVELFGDEFKAKPKIEIKSRLKRVNPMVLKHGVGPEEKRCKECIYIQGYQQSATWYRCEIRNGGRGDHKANWESCAKFEGKK